MNSSRIFNEQLKDNLGTVTAKVDYKMGAAVTLVVSL